MVILFICVNEITLFIEYKYIELIYKYMKLYNRGFLFSISLLAAFALSFVYINKDNNTVVTEASEELPPVAPYNESNHAYPCYAFDSEPNYSTQSDWTFDAMSLGTATSIYTGKNVKLAIIDSGINYTHEDFIKAGVNVVDTHSMSIEWVNSTWTLYTKTNGYESHLADTNGHGTNVAACVASQINGVGGSGIAPDVDLYIFNAQGYQWGAIQTALNQCVSLGVDIVNMSIQAYENDVEYGGKTISGGYDPSSAYGLQSHINSCYNHGITVVAAAGNYDTYEPSYPASYNHVISVGSLAKSSSTSKASYSNKYGIDVVTSGSVYVAGKDSTSHYKETQGTSFSSPLVAAVIALYKEKYPSATPSTIEEALKNSCDPISGNPDWAGSGRVNVSRFLGLDVTLESISVSEAPSKTTYVAGESFNPTGLVINRNYSDGSSDTYSYSGHSSEFSFTPSTALTTSHTSVTITYGGKTCSQSITVNAAPASQTLTITRSSFSNSGGYTWYDWSQNTSDGVSISGRGELYTTTTTSMQFNKGSGSKVAAIFNTTAIPGSITKIEAKTATGTNRAWNAYVTSTACSASGSNLTFGSNKTTVGSNITIGTSLTSFGTSNAGYSYFCIQENVSNVSYISEFKITYTPKTLSSISIKAAPTKTTYEAGEYFNPAGLVITATYSDNSTRDISYASSSSSFTFSPSTSTALTTSHASVTITYGGQSCYQAITVNAVKTLSSISISGYTTAFIEGDTFAFGGTVTANYSDGDHEDVTSSATFSGYNLTNTGNQTVTVSYTYKNTTKTQTYNITVSPGTLSSIAVSGQTTVYQKNASFSFDGVCTATFANNYQKTVIPTSVSSIDMSTGGNKIVTISYTYNGKTKTTTYEITVNDYRTVMEETYSVIATVTYSSETPTISPSGSVSVTTGGYTTFESNSLRLGSGSNTGSITVTTSTSTIYKIVVKAKSYGSDESVNLSIGGTNNTITNEYSDYVKTYEAATNSVTIQTTANKKRAHVQRITVYTKSNQDIGHTEDCVGLETFINTYMHMDYTQNLGYCKDNEHHYYSSAKTAFNGLNDHQRTLFTTNSAYLTEWTRLSTWASKNGDSLNASIKLAEGRNSINSIIKESSSIMFVVILGTSTLSIAVAYFLFRKKKES